MGSSQNFLNEPDFVVAFAMVRKSRRMSMRLRLPTATIDSSTKIMLGEISARPDPRLSVRSTFASPEGGTRSHESVHGCEIEQPPRPPDGLHPGTSGRRTQPRPKTGDEQYHIASLDVPNSATRGRPALLFGAVVGGWRQSAAMEGTPHHNQRSSSGFWSAVRRMWLCRPWRSGPASHDQGNAARTATNPSRTEGMNPPAGGR